CFRLHSENSAGHHERTDDASHRNRILVMESGHFETMTSAHTCLLAMGLLREVDTKARQYECGSIAQNCRTMISRFRLHRLQSAPVNFLREFMSKPATIGAVAPSSSFLAQEIVEDLQLSEAEAVIEYGPGTGVFTRNILREMKPTARFVAIE